VQTWTVRIFSAFPNYNRIKVRVALFSQNYRVELKLLNSQKLEIKINSEVELHIQIKSILSCVD